jgi:hypothetical protein
MPLQGRHLPAPARPAAPGARTGSAARPRKAARARPAASSGFAWCALAFVLLLEVALNFLPGALQVSPLQTSALFKQVSGYSMVTLLTFALALGLLRRLPGLASRLRTLGTFHQLSGLALLLLLASHVGPAPTGFLLYVFHAMAVGAGAGALRTVLGLKVRRALASGLLAVHITLSCLVGAGAVLHLYFVYVYAG